MHSFCNTHRQTPTGVGQTLSMAISKMPSGAVFFFCSQGSVSLVIQHTWPGLTGGSSSNSGS